MRDLFCVLALSRTLDFHFDMLGLSLIMAELGLFRTQSSVLATEEGSSTVTNPLCLQFRGASLQPRRSYYPAHEKFSITVNAHARAKLQIGIPGLVGKKLRLGHFDIVLPRGRMDVKKCSTDPSQDLGL